MRRPRRLASVIVAAACIGTTACAQTLNVSTRELQAGYADPATWITMSGDYTGQRHSPLTQITAANASQLAPVWTFETGGMREHFEASPILYDGVLYYTGPHNSAWAIDARTGQERWHYQRPLPSGLKACCGPVNRGFAVYGDRLFMSTLDAHLVALEMQTGKVIWDVEVADYKKGYASTAAPLVVKGRIIVGIAGGEFANRGFLDAYEPADGKRAWRFWTVPAPGEPGAESWPPDVLERGGAPTWVTGTFDPALNTLYWGTGNPNPDWDGDSRPGDNLYSNSLIALDPDSGTLKWFFQFTPHDTHDWDSNQVPVLADVTIAGTPRRVVLQANRNGFLYVLDRTNGSFIAAHAYGNQDWASGFTPGGKPVLVPGHEPSVEGTATCPDLYGNTNFMSPSFDGSRGLFFVTVRETCGTYSRRPTPTATIGERTMGGVANLIEPQTGALRAIDPITGARKWDVKYEAPGWAGVLSTAGGVVFTGDHAGTFMAVDAATGTVLYRYQTGGSIFAAPVTYMLGGKQYVALPSSRAITVFALP